MQKTWSNQNVNLDTLTKQIIQFFESKKFDDIIAFETETGYKIIAGNSPYYKMQNDTSLTIDGKPDNFSINLELYKEEKSFKFPIILTTMFGGGYFLLKNLKSDESRYKFEKDFWQNINSIIMQMKDSASSCPPKEQNQIK